MKSNHEATACCLAHSERSAENVFHFSQVQYWSKRSRDFDSHKVSLTPGILLTITVSVRMLSPGILERYSKVILSHTEFESIRTMLLVTISVSVRTTISSSPCPRTSPLWLSDSCRDQLATLSELPVRELLPEAQAGCVLVLSIARIRIDLVLASVLLLLYKS